MKKLILVALTVLLASCTYNVSMAHTEGTATDTIEDSQTTSPNVKADVKVPIK